MTSTPLTEIPYIDLNQIGKAATHNTGLDALDNLLAGILPLAADSLSSPYTIPYAAGDEPAVTKTALRFFKVVVSGAIGADWTAYLPAIRRHYFLVQNATTGGRNVIVKVSGQFGVTVPPNYTALCFLNGTDVEAVVMAPTNGQIGDFVSASVTAGSAVSLTSATAKNVTSIALPAGEWDVGGAVGFIPASGTTVTDLIAAVGSASAFIDINDLSSNAFTRSSTGSGSLVTGGNGVVLPTGMLRLSLAATTTVYLIGYSAFAVSTMTVWGFIRARRVK